MGMLNNVLRGARRYAQQNPDKVRQVAQKVAGAADRQTKGRYRTQIDRAVRKVSDFTGQRPPHDGGPGAV